MTRFCCAVLISFLLGAGNASADPAKKILKELENLFGKRFRKPSSRKFPVNLSALMLQRIDCS